MEEFRIESMSISTGVDSLRVGGCSFRSATGRSGGRERIKSSIISRASPRTCMKADGLLLLSRIKFCNVKHMIFSMTFYTFAPSPFPSMCASTFLSL